MNTKNKKNKDTYLSIRISKEDKIRIEKKANKAGMKISNYIRTIFLDDIDKKSNTIKLIDAATIIQDICNYVEKTYGTDEFIKEANEELWNSLL